ncbi:MAG: chromate transporter, partial [Firmicutes bacterium]|nr:chromate transporter [Bacillota bacterium]
DEILDYYALGQCTPGVIAVNVSTFVGHKKGGVAGAFAATFGMVFVPTILILTIAGLLTNYAENPVVQRAFSGIQVCVCVLVLDAVSKLWKKAVTNKLGLAIFTVVLLLSLFTDISTSFFVLAAGLVGLIAGKVKMLKEADKK